MDESGVGTEVLELYVEKQGEGGGGDEIVREINTQLRLGVKEKVTKKMLGAGEIIPRPEARNRRARPEKGTILRMRGDWVVLGSCGFLRLRVRRRRGGWCLLGTGWGRMECRCFRGLGSFRWGERGLGRRIGG